MDINITVLFGTCMNKFKNNYVQTSIHVNICKIQNNILIVRKMLILTSSMTGSVNPL